MALKRERVIIDVQDLKQAAKIEDTVYTGYYDVIKDNLVHWIAVEEDIIDSYSRLSKKLEPQAAQELRNFASESKETILTLRELTKSLETLGEKKANRIKRIKELMASSL
jgi:hypothetical protein